MVQLRKEEEKRGLKTVETQTPSKCFFPIHESEVSTGDGKSIAYLISKNSMFYVFWKFSIYNLSQGIEKSVTCFLCSRNKLR